MPTLLKLSHFATSALFRRIALAHSDNSPKMSISFDEALECAHIFSVHLEHVVRSQGWIRPRDMPHRTHRALLCEVFLGGLLYHLYHLIKESRFDLGLALSRAFQYLIIVFILAVFYAHSVRLLSQIKMTVRILNTKEKLWRAVAAAEHALSRQQVDPLFAREMVEAMGREAGISCSTYFRVSEGIWIFRGVKMREPSSGMNVLLDCKIGIYMPGRLFFEGLFES